MNDAELSQLQRVAVAPSQLQPPDLVLSAQQAHYLRRVLRLQTGDRFIVMDGQGQGWVAVLSDNHQAALQEPIDIARELPIPITLLVAMPKGSGMDEIVRQTTELGVASIWPVMSDRTLLQPSPAKVDRWRRIAREATEQAERLQIPQILDPQPWPQALTQLAAIQPETLAYLCVARGDTPALLTAWHQRASNPGHIAIATGPEGGWDNAEIQAAIAHHFQPVSLGQRILRAVTAPGCAIALLATAQEASDVSQNQTEGS